MAKLSEAFQSDKLSLSGAMDELEATLGFFDNLKISPEAGHGLTRFIEISTSLLSFVATILQHLQVVEKMLILLSAILNHWYVGL